MPIKETPRGLIGGRISPLEARMLQLPIPSINSLIGVYETVHAPKLLEFRVQDTVVTLRNYHHDRANNYLFGILDNHIKVEMIEGINWSKVQYQNGSDWKDFIPEKLRTAWPLLSGDSQMAVAIAAQRAVEMFGQRDGSR